MKADELEGLLSPRIGHPVRLVNVADVEMVPEKLRIHVHGILCPPDDSGEWSVVVKQCEYGTSVVGFHPQHVESFYVQPSGTPEITLYH
jgi:hypothetical protein